MQIEYGIYQEAGLTVRDELSGFTVEVAHRVGDRALGIHPQGVSVRASRLDGLGQEPGTGVGPWTISSLFSVTKPSTSLSTDSDSVTEAAATITIKGWNNAWYYKTNEANAACTSC